MSISVDTPKPLTPRVTIRAHGIDAQIDVQTMDDIELVTSMLDKVARQIEARTKQHER